MLFPCRMAVDGAITLGAQALKKAFDDELATQKEVMATDPSRSATMIRSVIEILGAKCRLRKL